MDLCAGAWSWLAVACLSGCGQSIGGGRDGSEDGGGDPNPNFSIGCSLPSPNLANLLEVNFTPRSGCVIPEGDSITLEHVRVTRLPIDAGTEIHASGQFTLGSTASAEIRMFVYYGQVQDCVGGVAHAPGGNFAVWGTTASVDGDTTSTISIDYSYATTSTDCRYDLYE